MSTQTKTEPSTKLDKKTRVSLEQQRRRDLAGRWDTKAKKDSRKEKLKRARARRTSEIRKARNDPNKFIEYCFQDSRTGQYLRQAKIHYELQKAMLSGVDVVNLFPRDHGKTTQLEGHLIWRLGNDPNLRIKIVCASDSKAVERLFAIIQHIKTNDRVQSVFPHLKPANYGDWCVPVDSTVHMADGAQRQVGDVEVGDPVWGWNAEEQSVFQGVVEHVSSVVMKPCVRVVTETGRSFRASADHRMLSAKGYKRAGQLEVGSPVAIGRGMGPGVGQDIPTQEARLLGYLVGDGYTATKAGGPWFTNGDGSVLADFESCLDLFGWRASEYADRQTYKMLGVVRGSSAVDPRAWLNKHGLLGKKSHDKRIPARLFSAGHRALVDFLRAYFVCDGCLDESVTRVSWTTTSHAMAGDLLRALRLLGTPARVTPDRATGAWKVSCAGWSAVGLVDAWGESAPLSDKERRLRGVVDEYKAKHDRSLRRSDLVCSNGVWRRRNDDDPETLGWERVVSVEHLGPLPCIDFTITSPVDTFLLDGGFVAHNTKHKIVVERNYISRDASIEALGVLSTATGGRADILAADDVVDRRNALELPKLRETVKSAWDSDWSNLLEPGGQIIYDATPWHVSDLTHKLLKNPTYEVMKRPVGEDGDPFKSIWSKWPSSALKHRHLKIGELEYNRGFRLIALAGEYSTVQKDWIEYWKEPPDVGALQVFLAFDVSSGEASDFFAAVVVGVDVETMKIYVLEAWHAKLTFLERAEAVESMVQRWQPSLTGIEQETMKSLTQYLDETTLLSIQSLRPHLSKRIRLMGISPLLQRGDVLFNPVLNPERLANADEHGDLVGELTEFPLAANDDLVDAFIYAVQLAQVFGGVDDGDGVDLGVSVLGAENQDEDLFVDGDGFSIV
jgi:phage terminase large subunit-like protein